jgi:hypothetical protein
MTKNWKKNLKLKIFVIIFFSSKIATNWASIKDVQATGEAFSPQRREHPAIQNMKFLYLFLFLWVIFALLDPGPEPATQINADTDPQPCREVPCTIETGLRSPP